MVNMADNGDDARQDASPCSLITPRKTRPRTLTPEGLTDSKYGEFKRSRRRSATVVNIAGEEKARGRPPAHVTTSKDRLENASVESHTAAPERTENIRNRFNQSLKDPSLQSNTPLSETSKQDLANESEGSSGSSQTITPLSPVRQDSSTKRPVAKQRKQHTARPNALHFLDSDSPHVTTESIQRTLKEASKASPETAKNTSPSARSISSTSSGFREDIFDVAGDHETDQATSPEHSIDGEPRGRMADEAEPRVKTSKGRNRSYGTPEMARGNVQLPHVPPEDLTPRAPNPHFVKHLPRAEKLPLTGYELLASRLSVVSADRGGPPLRPIYRRFETLNHRMLLHLQDEISELEEQLHRLDTADTQNRRLPNGILPASRRAEYMSGGELQWHKTDVLGKIGFKLEQYNRVLSSFRETLSLPPPTLTDMQQYRVFMANYAPIAEAETQFLDATDDLVCLGYSDEDPAEYEEEAATPRSSVADFHSRRRVSILSQSDTSRPHDGKIAPLPDQENTPQVQRTTDKYLLTHLSVAMAVAVILPIFTFLVIPGFIGRMTVVCLVGIGILGALIQGEVIKPRANLEFCVSVGLYGGVMAVLASMIG